MDPNDLEELIKTSPFVPFRLCMTDGRTLDVHHPEFVQIGKRGNAVIFERDDPRSSRFDRYVHVAILHIARAEPLETVAPR
jgi:hypothetical protein